MSSCSKTIGEIRKIRKYLQKSLRRIADRLVRGYKYGLGPLEREMGKSKQRKREMRERRRFHLHNRIHYEDLLAKQAGALEIYAKFAQKDRELYRALYGEAP